ncbi:L-fuculokinase [Salmonella enterica subsp. enterica]|uniref:L-fuculokinase n=1 Tax=Salmonella enterica I TaxID=59201 RepID=A0A379WMT4_SALET|nr:L-fuculokinase [Salmonella enterica subsp. enterica]
MISAGHDTQFALFGAGAQQGEPVLSSGTWEILMVRSGQVDTSMLSQYPGSTCELDSQSGLYNPECSGWPPAYSNGYENCCDAGNAMGKR